MFHVFQEFQVDTLIARFTRYLIFGFPKIIQWLFFLFKVYVKDLTYYYLFALYFDLQEGTRKH